MGRAGEAVGFEWRMALEGDGSVEEQVVLRSGEWLLERVVYRGEARWRNRVWGNRQFRRGR